MKLEEISNFFFREICKSDQTSSDCSICQVQMSHIFTTKPFVFQLAEEPDHDWNLWTISEFFRSLPSELCGSDHVILCFLFHIGEFSRQRTLSG